MRAMLSSVVAVVVAAASVGSARADDRAQALEIINKSIKALGGQETVTKTIHATMKGKGTVHAQGMAFPFVLEGALSGPDKSRSDIELDIMGQKIKVINVLNGGKGWTNNMGNVSELKDEELKDAIEQSHAHWVETLVPLSDKTFTLTLIGEIKVDNRPAVGIRVSYKDRRDVSLFFDKETHLLAKIETRARHPIMMQDALAETFYGDYKEVNGFKQPVKFKVLLDGTLFMEVDEFEVKPVEKLDDSLFGELK